VVTAIPAALSRRCILATDIAAYGCRTGPEQYEAQRAYEWAVAAAAVEAGLDRSEWIRQPAGDGELIVLPDGVVEVSVVAVLLPALAGLLRGYNTARQTGHRLRLRVAVHQGLIHLDGPAGFPGPAADLVSRLVHADPVRAVLHKVPALNLVVVVSTDIYRDVVVNRYGGVRPELFRRIEVQDRQRHFRADGWIHAPEADLNRHLPGRNR
jgi:hypothetical protein